MSRRWKEYINDQLYCECQLVTALNAYYFFHGKQFCKQGDEKYEELVNLVSARIGSAIGIEKVHKILGIQQTVKQGIQHWTDLDQWPKYKLPLEMNVWHKKTGFHSCLIVGYSRQCRAIRVANFRQATTALGWMFVEDVYQYLTGGNFRPFVFFEERQMGVGECESACPWKFDSNGNPVAQNAQKIREVNHG